jgi:hypothetical protein
MSELIALRSESLAGIKAAKIVVLDAAKGRLAHQMCSVEM